MEERKEGTTRFHITRTRLVNEVAYFYADTEEAAIDMADASDLDAWEAFDGEVVDDLTEVVAA